MAKTLHDFPSPQSGTNGSLSLTFRTSLSCQGRLLAGPAKTVESLFDAKLFDGFQSARVLETTGAVLLVRTTFLPKCFSLGISRTPISKVFRHMLGKWRLSGLALDLCVLPWPWKRLNVLPIFLALGQLLGSARKMSMRYVSIIRSMIQAGECKPLWVIAVVT